MRNLIIGGTGVISTGITRMLVERGDAVTVYNRGKREAEIPEVARMTGDRTDYAAFEGCMAETGTWDAVIDMVAYAPDDVASAIRAFPGAHGAIRLLQHRRCLYQTGGALSDSGGCRAPAFSKLSLCLQQGQVRDAA